MRGKGLRSTSIGTAATFAESAIANAQTRPRDKASKRARDNLGKMVILLAAIGVLGCPE